MIKNSTPVYTGPRFYGVTYDDIDKWWNSSDHKWLFNSETLELIKLPDFQFPGRKELEERDER